jgi:hypothetical protein
MPESTTKQPGALVKERSSRFGVDLVGRPNCTAHAARQQIGGG